MAQCAWLAMKVLIDGTPLLAGGGVQAAIALLMGLREARGVEWLAVMSEQTRAALGPELARDERVSFVRKAGWRDFMRINRTLHGAEAVFRPDVVFTVFGPAYFRARAPHVCGFARPAMIYKTNRTRFGRRAKDAVQAQALRRMDHVVVETALAAARVCQRLGIGRERISVIGNGVNPVFMEFSRGGFPGTGRRCILVPSAYYRHKNLEIIPEVAETLSRLEPELDFEFRLTLDAGSVEWRAIAREARERGVGGRVVTLGVLSLRELAEAYKQACAVALPTLLEISTAVYPEAFHMRRPLVTSNRDFARALCGDAALYAEPLDAGALADALRLVLQDGALCARLVAAGTARLATTYPTHGEKFAAQMALLEGVAADG